MDLTTMKQWRVENTDSAFGGMKFEDSSIPALGNDEVLVRFRAVSLNFRDLMVARGDYPLHLRLPIIPCSDGAGEVVRVGTKVSKWKPGDRVVSLMIQGHLYGPYNPEAIESGLGASLDGTLRQYGVFNQLGVVRTPKNLSFEEASTLSCAGVTSWNALYGLKPLRSGETVLVLGTGGVSLFALQFAKSTGAMVIATTSSEKKADLLKALGADHVVRYDKDPNWGQAVRALTPGSLGVDHIIEVGGSGTLEQSLKAIKLEGLISVIGAVSGDSKRVPSILECWTNTFTARGVAVGSRAMMEDMVAAIEMNNIHPVVDAQTFSLHEAKEAFTYYQAGRSVGKVVITID